jgi:hypothetical protein
MSTVGRFGKNLTRERGIKNRNIAMTDLFTRFIKLVSINRKKPVQREQLKTSAVIARIAALGSLSLIEADISNSRNAEVKMEKIMFRIGISSSIMTVFSYIKANR